MKTWSKGTQLGSMGREVMQVTESLRGYGQHQNVQNWINMVKFLAILIILWLGLTLLRTHYVYQEGLKLMKILLPQPPMSWLLYLLIDQQ